MLHESTLRRPITAPAALLSALLVATGCIGGSGEEPSVRASSAGQARVGTGEAEVAKAGALAASAANAASAASAAAETVVLVLGDSLAAGYRLPSDQAFPALVEQRLRSEGYALRIVNAGVSGDTTGGGLARLDWVLRANEPEVVLVELGGNDGLRGLSVEQTEANLRAIIERCRSAGAEVLLAGMVLPPNYGPDYTGRFAALFPRIAEDLSVALIPFLLVEVAARPEYNLPDGIHPNAAGQELVAGTVVEHLRPLLRPGRG